MIIMHSLPEVEALSLCYALVSGKQSAHLDKKTLTLGFSLVNEI